MWRNAIKYQAREYRHAFWDSGTILANRRDRGARLPATIVTACRWVGESFWIWTHGANRHWR
jgi:hypothetical protein